MIEVKVTTKSGRIYNIANIEHSFREFMKMISIDGFVIFNDIAIFANEIEAVEKI